LTGKHSKRRRSNRGSSNYWGCSVSKMSCLPMYGVYGFSFLLLIFLIYQIFQTRIVGL